MEAFIVIPVFLAFAGFILWAHHHLEQQRIAVWTEVASRMKLDFDGLRMSGAIGEINLEIYTETRGSGKSKHHYTVFVAGLDRKVPAGLRITYEGVFLKIGKVVGMQDIQLDLPGIDEKLMVRGSNEDEVRRWARRVDVSRGLTDLIELSSATFEVNEDSLVLEASGKLADPEVIEMLIEKLVHIARALVGRGYGALLDDGHW